jgi:hypothetical protein
MALFAIVAQKSFYYLWQDEETFNDSIENKVGL